MQEAHEDVPEEDGDIVSDSAETIPSDDEEDAPRPVLGESFLTNKHYQRINNHPCAEMAGRTSKTSRAAAAAKAAAKAAPSKRKAEDLKPDGEDSDATLSAEQQMNLRLQQLEAENTRLKTRQKLVKTKPGRKSKENSTDSATHGLVWDVTREQFFAIAKFLCSDDQLEKATTWVMNRITIEAHSGLKGSQLAAAQEEWVQKYKVTVRKAINGVRNYIQHQVRKKFDDFLRMEGVTVDDLPQADELIDVALRNGLTDKDPFPARAQMLFDFYWDVLVPVVASHKRWGPGKRHYCLMSTARPGGDPDAELFVTPSDEAYTLLVWENYLGTWTSKWQQAQKDKEPGPTDPDGKKTDKAQKGTEPDKEDEEGEDKAAKKAAAPPKSNTKGQKKKGEDEEDEDEDEELDEDDEEDQVPEVAPLYTQPSGGVQEFGGWNKAGRKRYRELLDLVVKSKGYPCQRIKYKGSKNQIKHIETVEKAALARIQKANGIVLTKKKRKVNPAARPNEDLDSDHEPDWA